MYVACSRLNVPPDHQAGLLAEIATAHDALASADGFRWAMLLRSLDDPSRLTVLAMWLTPEQAGSADFPVERYDVVTARGSMTPAAVAALVEWRVAAEAVPAFVSRWNAAYHAIEDTLGSRLLLDLDDPSRYLGLHVAVDAEALSRQLIERTNRDSGGTGLAAKGIEVFEVEQLHQASG